MASASPRHVASCLCLLLLVTAAAAQRLPVKSYSYGSFYRDDPSVSSLLFRGAAGVSNGALQVTPDSRNLNNFLSNKSGSERLEHTLTNLPGMPKEFAFEKLRKATKNFDERLRLGKGGYGMVYKGVLSAAAVDDDDGRPPAATEVAVKMFTRDDAKCVDDFLKEVQIIHRLRHRNIVPLVVA
uniref:Protein kinase domain-containing protein n=1 Tax=Oryza barthii TaxID=65489 RepID=A0A0D3H240_9ORYZ